MVLNIIEVVGQFVAGIFERGAIWIVYLRPPGDAGLDAVPFRVERYLSYEIVDKTRPLRTRTDEAHIAAQYIDELRQFIDPKLPYQRPDAGYARVTGRRPAW